MGSLGPGRRPLVGEKLIEVTGHVQGLLAARRIQLEIEDEARRLTEERIDVTLASHSIPQGSRHLLQQTIDEIVDIFNGLGYAMADGPEAGSSGGTTSTLSTPRRRIRPGSSPTPSTSTTGTPPTRSCSAPRPPRSRSAGWRPTSHPSMSWCREGLSPGNDRCHASPGVSPDRRVGRRRIDPVLRPEGDPGPFLQGVLRPEDTSVRLRPDFFPVHRALRRPLGVMFRL